MDKQQTFEQSLRTREFEPDAPNYTPRISGILHIEDGSYNYAMSILKSNNGNPAACNRYTFAYSNPVAGEGHFIHTYKCDGNPLPSFEGEPKLVDIPNDMNEFADTVWKDVYKRQDHGISLFSQGSAGLSENDRIYLWSEPVNRDQYRESHGEEGLYRT